MFEIKVSMCERERLNERGCPVRERVWEFACAMGACVGNERVNESVGFFYLREHTERECCSLFGSVSL